jgi:hypothetical protein
MSKTYNGQADIEAMRKTLTELEFALMPDDQNHSVNKGEAFLMITRLQGHCQNLHVAARDAS